jgi:catechol 2,3-dioxygenase-like lactoylglutathione lyase family enzyme
VEFGDEATPRFALHAIPSEIAAGIEIESPPRPREQSAAKLTFEVRDVAAALAAADAMGLPLLRRPWGDVDVVDPEGNVLALRAAP